MNEARDLDRLISAWLHEEAGSAAVTYREETLAMLEDATQRRRLRWVRPSVPQPPARHLFANHAAIPLLLLVAVLVAAAAIALVVGSRVQFSTVLPRPGLLALGSAGELAGGQIHLANRDGTGIRTLHKTPVSAELAGWSPDGSWLAYVTIPRTADAVTRGELVVTAADGTRTEVLASDLGGGDYVDWAPNGRELVYAANDGQLSVVDVRTKRVRSLEARGYAPAWSPQGDAIAFISAVPRTPPLHLRIVALSTLEETTVAEFDGGIGIQAANPEWSPDGRRLVFGNPDYADNGPRYQLAVATLAGGGWTTEVITGGAASARSPVWGADGSITFLLDRGPGRQAFANVAPDGSGLEELVEGDFHPSAWCTSSDGSAVGTSSSDGLQFRIFNFDGLPHVDLSAQLRELGANGLVFSGCSWQSVPG